ncbi:hypothetical protein [Croceimicrobium sp.]|uniref:hypothetical protein n=1 Tax=Croceimicrobium sp. TaxID=2828340 RepID=UPI003BAA842F
MRAQITEASPSQLDSTCLFTINGSDTLKGHFSEHISRLDSFSLVRRFYYHRFEKSLLQGEARAQTKRAQFYRDRKILSGNYHNGERSGTWYFYGNGYGFQGICTSIYQQYTVRYKTDSIIVADIDGSQFTISKSSKYIHGLLNFQKQEKLEFECQNGDCRFTRTERNELTKGHFDFLKNKLLELECLGFIKP